MLDQSPPRPSQLEQPEGRPPGEVDERLSTPTLDAEVSKEASDAAVSWEADEYGPALPPPAPMGNLPYLFMTPDFVYVHWVVRLWILHQFGRLCHFDCKENLTGN